jgi:hypothetical protein
MIKLMLVDKLKKVNPNKYLNGFEPAMLVLSAISVCEFQCYGVWNNGVHLVHAHG